MSLVSKRNQVSESAHVGDQSLNCTAHGCGMRWSVEAGNGRLCSFHAWSEPKKWPSITETLQRDGAWNLENKRECDLTDYGGNLKAWAMRLRDRHARGEHLNHTVVTMYRDALRITE